MTKLIADYVADFLAYKRALGRKYLSEEHALDLLIGFAKNNGIADLGDFTPESLDDFIVSRPRSTARSFNQLVGAVDIFFDWAVAQQLLEASPMHVARRRVTNQLPPFIFDPDQVRQLLVAAADLPDNARAMGRGRIHHTIFALCYGLGLRAGEACGLRVDDVEPDRRLLVVCGGKFGKNRLVPHGPRIGALLAQHRDQRLANGAGPGDPLFTFDGRRHVHPGTASQVFHRLLLDLAITAPDGVRAPNLHSLRHSFAVGCLLRWYREGVDPSTRLFHLSTFMGHVDPESTAVYLTITPQLLAEANRRFEQFTDAAFQSEELS